MTLKLGLMSRMIIIACAVFAATAYFPADSAAGPFTFPLAQVAAPPPVVAPPQKGYVLEGIVVVVLMAAAVFAVCRTSGRS